MSMIENNFDYFKNFEYNLKLEREFTWDDLCDVEAETSDEFLNDWSFLKIRMMIGNEILTVQLIPKFSWIADPSFSSPSPSEYFELSFPTLASGKLVVKKLFNVGFKFPMKRN